MDLASRQHNASRNQDRRIGLRINTFMAIILLDGFETYNLSSLPINTAWTTSGIGSTLTNGRIAYGGTNGSPLARALQFAQFATDADTLRRSFAPTNTFTVSFALQANPVPGDRNFGLPTVNGIFPLVMFEIAGTSQVGLRVNRLGGIDVIRFSAENAGTIVASTPRNLITCGNYYWIDLSVTVGSSGTVSLSIDHDQKIALTAINTQNHNSNNNIDTIRIGSTIPYTGGWIMDDLVMTNDLVGAGQIAAAQFFPISDNHVEFLGDSPYQQTPGTGGNFANINEITNDGYYDKYAVTASNISGTVGAIDLYNISPANYGTTFDPTVSIKAVKIVGALSKNDPAERDMSLVVKSGNITFEGNPISLAEVSARAELLVSSDPNSGAQWTAAAALAAAIGARVKS